MKQLIEQQYVKAFRGATRDVTTDVLTQNLEVLQTVIEQHPSLAWLQANPALAATRKADIWRKLLPFLNLHPLVARWVLVLARHNRLNLLPSLLRQLKASLAAPEAVLKAVVTTAKPLTGAQQKALQETLERLPEIQALRQPVLVQNLVDPQILGGLIIEAGHLWADMSVRLRLRQLAHVMKG